MLVKAKHVEDSTITKDDIAKWSFAKRVHFKYLMLEKVKHVKESAITNQVVIC